MNFSRFLDIQSWWEVPSIAYFCSLFRTAFNLLDFDIEELEEALLNDGTEESASSLLTELIVRLLNGCLGNNDISAFNYQMYLRRLFRRKCQESNRYNPFNTDIDFQFLPLRTKVEILYALCDFRLDAEDVFDLFKNLEAESLRVEPLGFDNNDSAYWYFYGTRLYREDIVEKTKGKGKKRKHREKGRHGWLYSTDMLDEEETDRVWQVVCFTEEDWTHLTDKFKSASSKVEKELYRSLSENFLPEIPKLFQEKERLQRKRLLELLPRRTSNRVVQKIKQKEDESNKNSTDDEDTKTDSIEKHSLARINRAKRRRLLRKKSKSPSIASSTEEESNKTTMPEKAKKRKRSHGKKPKNSASPALDKGEPPPDPPAKPGRKTNNSLSSATGQIVISDNEEPVNSTRKKLKTSQIFSQTEEDIQTDMYKVLEQVSAHEDAWPFLEPVEEEYAPNYYAVIRRPMDLHKMEERLDNGYYTEFSMFQSDFKLIVNNCRLYNGQDNEYTTMVDKLQVAFDRLTEKYIHRISSSDEEIAVEFPLPTPSRKHKLKSIESPEKHKKKRKSHDEPGTSKEDPYVEYEDIEEVKPPEVIKIEPIPEEKKSQKHKEGKSKKKKKSHHRHGKHSKNSKGHSEHKSKSSKHGKKRHGKDGKKHGKGKKKKNKHVEPVIEPVPEELPLTRTLSQESLESSNRSRSASPLPSIHTPTPSPTPDSEQPPDLEFYKDKFDKIKERRRTAVKDAWESLFEPTTEKQKPTTSDKVKNKKLRDTIERLKAKNEKYKESSLFNSLLSSNSQENSDSNLTRESSTKDEDDDSSDETFNPNPKEKKVKESSNNSNKCVKKNTAKNESASEALEQVVKDISMLLDESPKAQILSPLCLSPIQILSTDDNSRQDDESSQTEKVIQKPRKRVISKEPKMFKRREIQRTIDRLQPGKSKGNLLTNITAAQKIEETVAHGMSKAREFNKNDEPSPKLSLGSVLHTVEFSLGSDHKFGNQESRKDHTTKEDSIQKNIEIKENNNENKSIPAVNTEKPPIEEEIFEKPTIQPADFKSKTLPNLSAWLKAFGARKSVIPATLIKKKIEERDDDKGETNTTDTKTTSPKNAKFDSPSDEISPNPEGGESPLPNTNNTPRHRRTSTGSSISERSSFSQDLDSPRHQMSHTSPLLRSPASPRIDEFQKITYPIINGTVRAGFYHDTISMKSSPDKSCSPREGPHSPYSSYSPYSPHVYVSNSVMGSAPNYFFDHNKSPIPTYGQIQHPPPYYDSSKAAAMNTQRAHNEYPPFGPENPHNQFRDNLSTTSSTYNQSASSNFANIQVTSVPKVSTVATTSNCPQVLTDPKNVAFPVKKRIYPDNNLISNNKKVGEEKDANLNKRDYATKVEQTLRPMSNNSVDNIAMALSEKSELAKLNSLREKPPIYVERQHTTELHDNTNVKSNDHPIEMKKALPISTISKITGMSLINKDNIDMINMGYNNTDTERRNGDVSELNEFAAQRELSKTNIQLLHNKGYEVDAIAMNLGMNNQQQQKTSKGNLSTIVSTDKTNIGICFSSGLGDYESISLGNQNVGNFSMNDIEIANKKLYSNTPVATAATGVDYGNWKINNQIRKPDILPSDYSNSTYTATNNEKLKSDIVSSTVSSVNYSKNIQQQYHNYSPSRSNTQPRVQEMSNLPSELRIPNPRGHLKNDPMSTQIDTNMLGKTVENLKPQKPEQLIQNHPLVNSLSYKTSYPSNSQLQLESLRNLQNIPQMLERYTNDERYLSSLTSFPTAGSSSIYHDKSFQMAQMSQMFNKSISNDVHPVTSSLSIYSQPSIAKDTNIYKNSTNVQANTHELKSKSKRKRSGETKQSQLHASQSFHPSCTTDVLSSVKSSMVPGSAFNFGAPQNMALGGGFYSDNTGFSIEDIRNSTNQLMAANYVAAAVAHQRNNAEANVEKLVKPAHQNSSHSTTSAFPFMSHSQVRASYPFVGADPSSPLYQQYLQRQQEELIRQTGAHTIMGLYPPGYPSSLQARQPYDGINRPSWI